MDSFDEIYAQLPSIAKLIVTPEPEDLGYKASVVFADHYWNLNRKTRQSLVHGWILSLQYYYEQSANEPDNIRQIH